MQSAILFFIASSAGVAVGWQPMPDGSQSYEYVVQLDQDLLATMKQGDPIPISSEVPDDIRPIRRIRIVVGNETLPRQKLVTQFKPWPADPPSKGLVETQYVVPNEAPRYENQPILPADSATKQILPANSRPPSEAKSFGQALQQSAKQARNATSENQILPPTREILPPRSGPRYSEPIRTANQQDGRPWRDGSASSQAEIKQLFGDTPKDNIRSNLRSVDERSIVTGNQSNSALRERGPITPSTQPILPPGDSPNTILAPSNPVEIRPASDPSTSGPRYQKRDSQIAAGLPANQNQLLPKREPISSPARELRAPWPAPERFEDAPLAKQWNTQDGSDNRLASQPDNRSLSNEWPKPESGAESYGTGRTPDPLSTPNEGNALSLGIPSDPPRAQSSPSTPEIRREMLNQPADAELRTAGGDLVRPTPASLPPPTNQETAPEPQPRVLSQPEVASTTSSSPSTQVFPLVLAWVLLSGSGAGNLYLFWSYLDIRNKYSGLLRKAGRKLGRISDEEEYDDYDD